MSLNPPQVKLSSWPRHEGSAPRGKNDVPSSPPSVVKDGKYPQDKRPGLVDDKSARAQLSNPDDATVENRSPRLRPKNPAWFKPRQPSDVPRDKNGDNTDGND